MTLDLDLLDKVAVVTGGSRGIGRAIALELATHGAAVLAVGRDEEALAEVRAAAERLPGQVATLAIDLRSASAADVVIARVKEEFGRLDILINNAGATKRGDFLALTDAEAEDGFALKYFGAVRLCRAAWRDLRETRGAIVNIAGIGAHTPEWEFSIGGPVNSAIINFTKAIAQGGLRDGIRVNVVCPGHVATDRLRKRIRVRAENSGLSPEAAREEMRTEIGLSRFGEPEDVAAMVAFLCSRQASYVHGATIDVDGGATRGV